VDKLQTSEIRVGADYERVRGEARRRVAEMKRHRRVALGDELSLVFENRETIRAVVEEMLRAERITDPDRVSADVEAFNTVIHGAGTLDAVLYLEIPDPADLAAVAARLEGVERTVYLEVSGARIPGEVDEVSVPEEAPSAFYITFRLNPEHRSAWLGGAEVTVGVDHPERALRTSLDDDQRRAVSADL
jgi:hypothetical protein